MNEYEKTVQAKIAAGPTAPSKSTRQSRRAAQVYQKPADFTDQNEPNRAGNRAKRRAAAKLEKFSARVQLEWGKATKKGARHLRDGMTVHEQKQQPARVHVSVGQSSHATRRQNALREMYGSRA